jgi:3',5'-cyclic AMP phosphodiesterase CpdA
MRTIAHLSDLHFGTEDPTLAAALTAQLSAAPPDLVIVSGDLTQRARRKQFTDAHEYLRTLPRPQLVVPGNHDVPLFDVVRRFVEPYQRYRQWINPELCPVFHDAEMVVVGINTARSLTWKDGRISPGQIEVLRTTLTEHPAPFRVVVTHHPFIPPPAAEDESRIRLVGRAVDALEVLDEHRVDLLLAGHLHEGYSGVTQRYYPRAQRAIISAQAGTAISRRIRQQPNAYNWIRLEHDRIEIEVRTWNGSTFGPTSSTAYQREQHTWARV